MITTSAKMKMYKICSAHPATLRAKNSETNFLNFTRSSAAHEHACHIQSPRHHWWYACPWTCGAD